MSARNVLAVGCALLPCVAAPEAAAIDVAAPVTASESSLGCAVAAEPAMVAEINSARAAHGLRPLRPSASLCRSAHRYAAWMLRSDYFGHLPAIRASRRFRQLGETLALHFGWQSEVGPTVRRWLASPAHRSLLLSRRFRALGAGQGAGVYRGQPATTWVLHLGA